MKLDSLLVNNNRRLVLTVDLHRQTSPKYICIAVFAVFLARLCIFSWLLSVIYGHMRSVSHNSVWGRIILLMLLEGGLLLVVGELWGGWRFDGVRRGLKRARACLCRFEHQVGAMLCEKLTMRYYLVTWIHETILRRHHRAYLIMLLLIMLLVAAGCIIRAILVLDNIFIQFDPASSLFGGRTAGSMPGLFMLRRLLKIWGCDHHWRQIMKVFLGLFDIGFD